MAELIDDAWRRRTPGRWFIDEHMVVVEAGEGSWTATATGPAALRSAVAEAGRRAGVAVTLDGAGEFVMSAGASGLPVALGVSMDGVTETGGGRRRLYLAGLAVLVVLLAGGTAFIGRAMQRELAVARLQTDFVAAVSHEFRTPLTSIRHLTELLAKDRIHDPAQIRKSYELMMSESDRLKRLIESLLDFGRMQSGTYRFRREPIELNTFAGDVVAAFGGEVAVAVEAAPVWVMGDREALRGALWNLLENAVKYSPGAARVRVAVEATDGNARVAVADAGMGIPKAEQGRIFDRFYRGAAARSGGMKGTGIGLAMVREVMTGHGGRVRVESEVGQGSTFTLELPLGREA
jgi:signal transduction histidine kinase